MQKRFSIFNFQDKNKPKSFEVTPLHFTVSYEPEILHKQQLKAHKSSRNGRCRSVRIFDNNRQQSMRIFNTINTEGVEKIQKNNMRRQSLQPKKNKIFGDSPNKGRISLNKVKRQDKDYVIEQDERPRKQIIQKHPYTTVEYFQQPTIKVIHEPESIKIMKKQSHRETDKKIQQVMSPDQFQNLMKKRRSLSHINKRVVYQKQQRNVAPAVRFSYTNQTQPPFNMHQPFTMHPIPTNHKLVYHV